MPVFNQSRSRIIRLIFLVAMLIIAGQLFYLQIVSVKYQRMADENAIRRSIVYPPRGLVFDRHHNPVVQNTLAYDLMVVPIEARNVDRDMVCQLLDIDSAEYQKRITQAIIKNRSVQPSVFESSLSPEKYARWQQNQWRFPNGFYIQERQIRSYPDHCGANIVGYIGEVDSNYLRRHADEGYQSGDYAGMTGLESSYEKVLMGERGIQYLLKDKNGRVLGPYENGDLDEPAVAGKNLYTSLDVSLQKFGEKLMTNKVGSIVAIDPKTGGVLCMVTSPTFDPNYLTGGDRRRHFSELYQDPRLPLLNRAVNASYSPGSTFKTLQALVGLHEGVITTQTTFSCSGAFYGCGSAKPMRCLDPGTFNLKTGITHSCNTYFANVMQRVINNPQFPSQDSSLRSWDEYMYSFGLGHRLGVDVPTEQTGYIPTPEYFNKIYGQNHWNFCTYRSVSIGQGEVTATPIQVANEMAYIANKGWFITPHVVDSIEGGDKFNLLERYQKRNRPIDIPDTIFTAVHDGMQGVMESGTGRGAKVPGIVVCGKTGTVENYYRGVKQPNHSFFAAFAPRDNPKIAIMCVVENSGRFGGTYAAPIVSLMIEKYLKDTIAADRLPLEKRMTEMNLIPPMMLQKMKTRDSLRKVRADSMELIRQRIEDSIQSAQPAPQEELRQLEEDRTAPPRDSFPSRRSVTKADFILFDDRRNAVGNAVAVKR